MKMLLVVVFVLLVGVAALGYSRDWFSVTKDGKLDVQVDSDNFKHDREAFSKTVASKAKAMKDDIAGLWTKAEGLTGDEKTHAKAELADLEKKHDRIEQQLKELKDSGEDTFSSTKQDLSRSLVEVEQQIEALTQKLAKTKDK